MMRRRVAGFTLVELLVAITVFAVLSAMAYGGLRSVMRSEQAIEVQAQRLQAVQQTLLFLGRDFAQVAPRAIRDEFGDRQPPLRTLSNSEVQLEFTRAGWSNPALQMRATLQRVGYGLEGKQLVRYSWRVLDRAPDSQPVPQPLLDRVSEWHWRFLDEKGAWLESWPPLGSDGLPSSALPRAVEIRVVLEDLGSIRRLFPLDLHPAVAVQKK